MMLTKNRNGKLEEQRVDTMDSRPEASPTCCSSKCEEYSDRISDSIRLAHRENRIDT